MATIAIPIHKEPYPISSAPSLRQSGSRRNKLHSMSTNTPSSTVKLEAVNLSLASTPTRKQSTKSLDCVMGKDSLQNQGAPSFNNSNVLHTPRRGRRVGKVDLGWESPISQHDSSTMLTPRKRKIENEGRISSSGPSICLFDSQGRASAAIAREVAAVNPFDGAEEWSNPSHSRQTSLNESPSKAAKYDKLAGFQKEEDTFALPTLVSIDVPLMGRMAVHRSAAGPIACIDTTSLAHHSSQASGSGSSIGGVSSSTKDTSLGTPSTDPSPSFSLSSHFPASEPSSPSKAYTSQDLSSLLYLPSAGLSIEEKIQTLRDAQRHDYNRNNLEDAPAGWKPRLLGSGMPLLNWPDSPSGPWSSAGKEMRRLQEQKRRGIARWLEEDSEDEDVITNGQDQQHPMIAKAMHDRARKEMLIRSFSMPQLRQSKRTSPSKKSSRRKAKLQETPKRRTKDSKTVYLHPPGVVGRLATSSSSSSIIGCACGSKDESTSMVMCDACNLWFHLACSGISDVTELSDEWYCHGCCDMAASVLSPSSLGDRASLIATPNFPRSAAIAGQQLRLSQGQLPVFAQPISDSPLLRGLPQQDFPVHGFSSGLALAPSPPMLSSHDDMERRSNSARRHRASRIGWHQVEPGSPLDRKMGTMGGVHRRTFSGNTVHIQQVPLVAPTPSRRRVPTLEQGKFHSDYTAVGPPRTPSPHLMSTPSRTRSSNTSARQRRESSVKEFDDIFSTPSRILQGSASWGGTTWQHMPNHNTSMLRHSREDSGLAASNSTPWGLSTPTQFMDSADFNSDHSEGNGGLPSLVFSSGGLDLADLTWQLQSPSSSTRAATRARQNSSNRIGMANTSSVREKTPIHQSSQGNASCPSSSPFPKTPTFPEVLHHHQSHHHHHHSHSPQIASNKAFNRLSQQMTPSAANVNLQHATAAANAADLSTEGRRTNIKSRQANAATAHARARNVSSGELMAGLGIGLDLEDVLNWA